MKDKTIIFGDSILKGIRHREFKQMLKNGFPVSTSIDVYTTLKRRRVSTSSGVYDINDMSVEVGCAENG